MSSDAALVYAELQIAANWPNRPALRYCVRQAQPAAGDGDMRGLMMDRPLLVSALLDFGAEINASAAVVSRRVEGDTHRYTYREAAGRAARLAHALRALGIAPGDRVATMAWNGYRHLEVYYAASGIGAVCHTINPRLFPEQLAYIVNHAEDKVLFIDATFLPLVESLAARMPTLKHVVVLADAADPPETTLPNALVYEALIEGRPDAIEWPELDENAAASLCYTSGTTGNPKGVLYSHRSTVLHALSVALSAGDLRLTRNDRVLPVVPLFHVNAWGLPYIAPITGATLVFPGPKLDGASLFDLMESEGVTASWGVPTVWLGLLAEMRRRGAKPAALASILVGGSAPPRAMIEEFEADWRIDVVHGWGMTEMSPVGALGILPADQAQAPPAERIDRKLKQGRRMFQVDMKIIDATGKKLPHDGETRGELLVRGPMVTAGYYEDAAATAAAFDKDGWFRTGDIATIDPDGFVQIVDRIKDIIKSGGEWISSIDLENAAMSHPAVAEAAVIGLPHPKWGERPLLVLVLKEKADAGKDDILAFLATKVAKWWLPDDVVFVDALPHSATGKLQKSRLREQFKDHVLPTAGTN
jgi:fatty-acyl-CoA synthase